ncbi:MAG: hypothetical protein HY717_23870 [Planctomycetes bacterium]|nr:hypothetical protein [Planctomycetota bacterium]
MNTARHAARGPFWTTRQFRRLVVALVMLGAMLLVWTFEILLILKARSQSTKVLKLEDLKALLARQPVDSSDPRFSGGTLEMVQDATLIEPPDEAYALLVEHLSRADPGKLAKEALPLDYRALFHFPGELRGRAVRFPAVFLQAVPLNLERRAGAVDLVFRTYLADPAVEQGYVIDFLESPLSHDQRDAVTVEAVFYKIGTYEGRNGPVQAPFLVGRRLKN